MSLAVYQIYFREEQRAGLDPAFRPFDNFGEASPLREYGVFRRLARRPELRALEYWGAVSWKFGRKTGLSGRQLLAALAENPGYDVYYCNPHPDTEALYHNLWVQGEPSHPQFGALAGEIFRAAGIEPSALDETWPSALFATANYFVARPRFWEGYLAFVDGVLEAIESRLPAHARALLDSPGADPRGVHANASYLPFVIERLFSAFLLRHGGAYRAFKYLTRHSLLERNVHLRRLREMRDRAVATRCEWMLDCWTHYRRMYLAQVNGAAWLKKYQPLITPARPRFPKPLPGIVYPAVDVRHEVRVPDAAG